MAPKIDDYQAHSTQGNDLERGGPKSWDWTRDGGHYFSSEDFFSVHWEVHLPRFPDVVRLHVEAPRAEKDETLNTIKRDVVDALQAAGLDKLATNAGMAGKPGSRVSTDSMKKNKCTEAFRVVLSPGQCSKTHRDNIEAVHAVLGACVDEVLQKFHSRLQTASLEERQ